MDPILALLLSGIDVSALLRIMNQQGSRQTGPAQQYPFNPPTLTASPQEGGAGFGDGTPGSTKGTAESGKLSGQLGGLMSGFSGLRSGVGLANNIAGMLGYASPAISAGLLATTPISVMNAASKMFGGPPELSLANTFGSLQDIADYQGYMAADAQRQANERAVADWNAQVAMDDMGYANYYNGPAGQMGGVSVGADSASGGPGTAGSGGPSGGVGGHDQGNEGGWRAQGGVDYATRPTIRGFGERGPETAIYIPQRMAQPGLQGREAEVKNALLRALLMLRGRR